MSKYYNLTDYTIETFDNIFKKKAFPFDVKFDFIGSESQKTLIKISKIPDQYSFKMGKELLVSMNETLMGVFDEESIGILIEQEIDRVSVNIDSGKIKLIKPDINTFSGLINKYGISKIAKANQVQELFEQQKKDGQEEFIV